MDLPTPLLPAKAVILSLKIGLISKAEYVKLKEKYDQKMRQLQKEIQNCSGERKELSWKTEFEDWLEKFTDNFNVEDLTREMVLNLIDSIYIYENKEIEINYKFSLDNGPVRRQAG